MAARRASGHRRVLALLAVAVCLSLAGSAGYVIRPGDTLSGIAQRTGVRVADLSAANGIADADHIVAGRTLRLPGAAAQEATAHEHTVTGGDTVIGLARRYGSSVRAIVDANRLANPNRILRGQQLRIPGRASAGAAAPATGGGVEALLEQTARRYGMSPRFVKAVAWQESGWKPHVVSSASAVGVMQVLPSTGRFVSTHIVGRPLDLRDPADNIEAGVAFLRYVYRLAGGDVDLTLAGYYQGLRSVRENGMYSDTRRYIANVKALRERF